MTLSRSLITTGLGLALVSSCGSSQKKTDTPAVAVTAPAPAPVPAAAPAPAPAEKPLYLDPARPVAERVDDLIRRMTLEEKVSQMMDKAAAIPRLQIPEYGWWNEALHGVARAGTATVFPQAIGLAATFDEPLMFRVATVISDEGRAKHHEFARKNERKRYQGLTFFSPNVNIFRDPRWGRGHETYGEDPYLTGRLGVAFIKGMQGDHPKYLKTVATAKHYAVHSGPEADRHKFDARVSERELFDTYLPHFEMAAREGKVLSVMPAYNAVSGEPAASNARLLDELLRKKWGFDGYVVTDCGAIKDIWRDHKVVATREEASARAVKAGTDLECGREFASLTDAVKKNLITEAELDRALRRLFTARFRLGMFDPPEMVPFAQIPYSVNDSAPHRALALEASRKSLVLLENRNGALPLKAGARKVAVIGPTADNGDVLLGNYHGTPSKQVTILEGIRKEAGERGAEVLFAAGSELVGDDTSKFAEAVDAAKKADVVVLVLGLSPRLEGEEGERKENPSGDRHDIGLPPIQEKLMNAVIAAKKPTVLVLTGGSALAANTAKAKIPGILLAWYPGQDGGLAVAEALYGETNPGGRLPLTFYKSTKDLPGFSDYSMKNRTYRYYTGDPLWGFGHGLSYTTFKYGNLKLGSDKIEAGKPLTVSVDVENTGKVAGDEVVQLYVTDDKASVPVPLRSLAGFKRVALRPGDRQTVSFELPARALSIVDEQGRRIVEPGTFTIAVGGRQPGKGNKYRAATEGLTTRVTAEGQTVALQ